MTILMLNQQVFCFRTGVCWGKEMGRKNRLQAACFVPVFVINISSSFWSPHRCPQERMHCVLNLEMCTLVAVVPFVLRRNKKDLKL